MREMIERAGFEVESGVAQSRRWRRGAIRLGRPSLARRTNRSSHGPSRSPSCSTSPEICARAQHQPSGGFPSERQRYQQATERRGRQASETELKSALDG